MSKVKNSKVVSSDSEEAVHYDFSKPGGDGYMGGNVKFVWMEFHCPKCDKQFSIDEIYQIERISVR